MDEIAHARAAFREGIGDITPEALRKRLEEVLESASLTPGALTVLSARTLDETVELDVAANRGAGVQMSYEGLRLSRELIRTDPWSGGNRERGDMDVIAAEVLVARGFEYLAHTGVAIDVVEAVRRFGRDQTTLEEPEPEPGVTDQLEADFIRIGVEAGADVALCSVPDPVSELAAELGTELGSDPLSDPERALAGIDERVVAAVANPDTPAAGEFSRSSGT